MASRNDLTPLAPRDVDWTPDNFRESIDKLVESVREKAREAIEWYVAAKRPKRLAATVLRFLTILSTSSAGILTVLAQIYDGQPAGELRIAPIMISLRLAIAAALLGFDRYFGFSRGWIRYVGTELKLRTALNQFNMTWPERLVTWADGNPDTVQVREAIAACAEFREQIDLLVGQETDQWVADF